MKGEQSESLFDTSYCVRCGESIPAEYKRCENCAMVEKFLPKYLCNKSGRTFVMNLIILLEEGEKNE